MYQRDWFGKKYKLLIRIEMKFYSPIKRKYTNCKIFNISVDEFE